MCNISVSDIEWYWKWWVKKSTYTQQWTQIHRMKLTTAVNQQKEWQGKTVVTHGGECLQTNTISFLMLGLHANVKHMSITCGIFWKQNARSKFGDRKDMFYLEKKIKNKRTNKAWFQPKVIPKPPSFLQERNYIKTGCPLGNRRLQHKKE